jgi:hypothetical protein
MPMGPRRGRGRGPAPAARSMRRRRRRRRMLVGGLVAFGAYKMTSKQSQDIEAHTGVDPEEMTDQELAQAMDELGIEKQEVTEADKDA